MSSAPVLNIDEEDLEPPVGFVRKTYTPRQRAFLRNVARGMTFREAALKAGYRHPYHVRQTLKEEVEKILDEQDRGSVVDANWIRARLIHCVQRADRIADEIKALELLGKMKDIRAFEVEKSPAVAISQEVLEKARAIEEAAAAQEKELALASRPQ